MYVLIHQFRHSKTTYARITSVQPKTVITVFSQKVELSDLVVQYTDSEGNEIQKTIYNAPKNFTVGGKINAEYNQSRDNNGIVKRNTSGIFTNHLFMLIILIFGLSVDWDWSGNAKYGFVYNSKEKSYSLKKILPPIPSEGSVRKK